MSGSAAAKAAADVADAATAVTTDATARSSKLHRVSPRMHTVILWIIAIAIIVIADMANTRVRSAEEAAELTGLTVIGRIPVIK